MGPSLDLSLVFVPKTISDFLGEISTTTNGSEKLSKLDDYVRRLEDERRKIEAFKRELPLCMLLLTDAIGRLKEQAMQRTENDSADKKNWMSSAQLWSNGTTCDYKKEDSASEAKLRGEEDDRSVLENPAQPWSKRKKGGAFEASKEENEVSQVTGLSLMTPPPLELNPSNSVSKKKSYSGCRGGSSGSSLSTDPQRKQRRYWSPQLHRCFSEAVRQLGVATPKQIRDLMQVDGLTNDEVKSHLQKYRLHVRKLSSSSNTNGLCMAQDQWGEHSNPNSSLSSSPQATLLAVGSAKGLFSVGDDSNEAGDEKSDGHSSEDG
ncbi:transcription factor HHO5 isoform X2 [Alnus glutinosa]|uniref:transcription factor HHO5 isoform X2 n=1 Tax=Alnus glutinosa TaxID=3517 RepID=UPI002D76E08B|nr:transcription factor HHO5 isoform X2 [Alnus glutinosa]